MRPETKSAKPGGALRTFVGATSIVTGAASGIGRALAEELARRGSEVILADRQIEQAERIAADIRGRLQGRASAFAVDVRHYPQVEQLVQQTLQRSGRLDYLFNNAGIRVGGPAVAYRIDDWNAVVDVNLGGVIHGVQAAYPLMVAQGFGHIVNTASLAGLIPSPGGPAYAAAKHGVVGLSCALSAEAAASGIRVSVLCPGVIQTAMLSDAGKFGKMLVAVPAEEQRRTWGRLGPMAASVFARKALDRVAANRLIVIIPARWRVLWWISRYLPGLGMFIARKGVQLNKERRPGGPR